VKQIQLLAIDMDGTLMRDDKTISETDIVAIRELISSGVEVVAASGRPLAFLPEEVLDLPIKYAIVLNGAAIIDFQSGEMIYHQTMDNEMASSFIYALMQMDVWISLESSHGIYQWGNNVDKIAQYFPMIHNFRGEKVADLRAILEDRSFPLEKIGIRTLPENQQRILDLQRQFIGLNIMEVGQGAIEANDRMSSKGAALKWLTQHLGISRENTAAIGDSDNDLIMLSYSVHSFAMANATAFVKNICRYQTTSNENNGVKNAIAQIIKINNSAD